MSAHTAYIGLGSNLGDSTQEILRARDAIAALPSTQYIELSPLYRSIPVGPPGQPDYINAAAKVVTRLCPTDLLKALQAIEDRQLRVRQERWGPRTIDLDILLFDDLVVASTQLTIPHPHMTERNFVLIPLQQLAPDLILPNGESLAKLVEKVGTDGLWSIEEDQCNG